MEAGPSYDDSLNTRTLDSTDDSALARHIQQCEEAFVDEAVMASARYHRAYINAHDGAQCAQHPHFDFRWVCNTSILVYIVAPGPQHSCRARAALGTEFHKANPDLVLQRRRHFLECSWEYQYPFELEDRLDVLVQNHLSLCDWMENSVEALRTSGAHKPYLRYDPLTDSDTVLPTMRAIMMFFWPGSGDSDESHVAVVLTGDCRGLVSGPLTLDSLDEHRIPGYTRSDRVVHVSLDKAAHFIAHLDQRETAANKILRERNSQSADQTRRTIVEAAEEQRLLSKSGGMSIHAASIAIRERAKQERYEMYIGVGYTQRQAKLAAMMCTW